MVKVYALLPPRPDIDVDRFHAHWRNPHGELAKRITTMLGYVQSHVIADRVEGLPPSIYRGIAEVWFESLAVAFGMGSDPNYTEGAGADEPNFIDVERLAFLMCAERVVVPGPEMAAESPEVKVVVLLRAREEPGASLGDRLLELPFGSADGLRRYVVSTVVPEMYVDGPPAFDAVLELAWADRGLFESGWRSVTGSLSELAEAADLGNSSAVLTEPYRVRWPVATS